LLDDLRNGLSIDDAKVSADIARVRRLYDSILRDKYDKPEPRIADLDQLQTIAAGYPDRATFLSALALEPPQATQDLPGGSSNEDEDLLVLSTAHSAKGKEWDSVFVIWCVDGWFPSARCLNSEEETDEERRLMYVAMTRAKNHLAVTYPLNAYSSRRGSDYSIDQLSRFIDRGVRDRMERVAVGAKPVEGFVEKVAAPVMDLRALLRGRFG
jgi:DNA helicase-2/ATP-dependent DNA helicase PcrA